MSIKFSCGSTIVSTIVSIYVLACWSAAGTLLTSGPKRHIKFRRKDIFFRKKLGGR